MNIDKIIEREFAKTKDHGGYAPRIFLQESELRALLLEATEECRKDAERLMLFVGRIIERDDGGPYEWDGGDIQNLAERCGMFVTVEAKGSCGEFCNCFDFPTTCYRLSELGKQCAAIAAEGK
jgi:hypothetical protein